jgi:hypothetical protein
MRANSTYRAIYNSFLLESLGPEPTGMDLSVLSALARTGVDPWAEAERLSSLPKGVAAQSIRASLAHIIDSVGARRLADLLPEPAQPVQQQQVTATDQRQFFKAHGLAIVAMWLFILVGFALTEASVEPDTQPVATKVSSVSK